MNYRILIDEEIRLLLYFAVVTFTELSSNPAKFTSGGKIRPFRTTFGYDILGAAGNPNQEGMVYCSPAIYHGRLSYKVIGKRQRNNFAGGLR